MDKYSTFWLRFAALLIDGVVLSILSALIQYLLGTGASMNDLLPYIYTILMVGRYGQTVGKMAMKIKVVDHITEESVGYTQSFKREAIPFFLSVIFILLAKFLKANDSIYDLEPLEFIVLFIPSGMQLIWMILEIVTMLNDSKGRALHDKIAGTVVIKSEE